MKKNSLPNLTIILFWLITLVACTEGDKPAAITPSIEMAASPTASKSTPTPEPSKTPTPFPLPTQTSVIPTPTMEQEQPQFVVPIMKQVCEGQKDTPKDIGIQDEIFLTVTFDAEGNDEMENLGAMIAKTNTLLPEPIPGTTPKNGMLLWYYTATPDGQWVDLKYGSQELNRIEEKLISWDGGEYRELYTGDYADFGYKFLYQENLLIILDESNNGFRPITIRDLGAGTEREIPGFPENGYWSKLFYVTQDDVYNWIFWQGGRGDDRLYLYNDSNQSTVPAFSWISEPAGWLTATPYRDADGKFGIYAVRSYGLDLATGLDIQMVLDAKPYDEVMKKILLPGEDIHPSDMQIQRIKNGLLLVRKTAKEERRFAVYRLNFTDLSLEDYCISGEADKVTIAISFDERFAAVNFFVLDPPGFHVRKVILLNLQTGQWTSLPNPSFEIVGFLKNN